MRARMKWDLELDSKHSREQLLALNKYEKFTLNCKKKR
jgi:hypothetical protein